LGDLDSSTNQPLSSPWEYGSILNFQEPFKGSFFVIWAKEGENNPRKKIIENK
jgi:hypothetical protein